MTCKVTGCPLPEHAQARDWKERLLSFDEIRINAVLEAHALDAIHALAAIMADVESMAIVTLEDLKSLDDARNVLDAIRGGKP